MNGGNKNDRKSEKEKNGKLICFLVNNETVYRTWRTFLQAAIGVFTAGLFEYLAGRFTGQSPQKVIPYFIATAVAAGISAVMNRSDKKGNGEAGSAKSIAENLEKATDALLSEVFSENGETSEMEPSKEEENKQKEDDTNGETG